MTGRHAAEMWTCIANLYCWTVKKLKFVIDTEASIEDEWVTGESQQKSVYAEAGLETWYARLK